MLSRYRRAPRCMSSWPKLFKYTCILLSFDAALSRFGSDANTVPSVQVMHETTPKKVASQWSLCASACNWTQTWQLVQNESMWVDKYTPRSFLELLGDEEINREVVRWLKCWDRTVFGDRAGAAPSRAARGRPGQDSRPEEKILLICGAPGEQLNQHAGCKASAPLGNLPRTIASMHDTAGSLPEISATPITGLHDITYNAAHVLAKQWALLSCAEKEDFGACSSPQGYLEG